MMEMKLKQNLISERIKKIKRMRVKFDIKIKWNLIIRDKIEEKNQSKEDKKKLIAIKTTRTKLNMKYKW
jgi:hypothetical protein